MYDLHGGIVNKHIINPNIQGRIDIFFNMLRRKLESNRNAAADLADHVGDRRVHRRHAKVRDDGDLLAAQVLQVRTEVALPAVDLRQRVGVPWVVAGHHVGEGYSVQANMMLNDKVVSAMSKAYEGAEGDLAGRETPLAEGHAVAFISEPLAEDLVMIGSASADAVENEAATAVASAKQE